MSNFAAYKLRTCLIYLGHRQTRSKGLGKRQNNFNRGLARFYQKYQTQQIDLYQKALLCSRNLFGVGKSI